MYMNAWPAMHAVRRWGFCVAAALMLMMRLCAITLTLVVLLCWPSQVRNEKARRFLANMRKKLGVDLAAFFPRADRGALALLRRLLAFDPADRWAFCRCFDAVLRVKFVHSGAGSSAVTCTYLHFSTSCACRVCYLVSGQPADLLLACDASYRPSAEEALADPYFSNLHSPAREPSAQVGQALQRSMAVY